jgi:putative oxygen-independent coproporphyrinogen III oxidase
MSAPLSLYLHVPFCASRCGYCDFNTYTATELGDGVDRASFYEHLAAEITMAARQLAATHLVDTVFVGGGTPTLIGADALNHLIARIHDEFDVSPDVEVTTEANPDSVDEPMLTKLKAGGFTRISFGLQSSVPHVLAVLERTHTPGAGGRAARLARSSGFEHVNLDVIYSTPGESDDDLQRTLDEVLDSGVDHVSAYSLIVEQGTALARRVDRGEIPAPDDDVAADRYELIDDRLQAVGLEWYEVSNWSRPGGECRHNLAYWRNRDWWGIGPGAHSHLDGTRWWNVKHPRTYTNRITADLSPMEEQEITTAEQQRLERIMMGLRLAEGLPVVDLEMNDDDIAVVSEGLIDEGLIEPGLLAHGRLALTRRGRLLADAVVRRLVD